MLDLDPVFCSTLKGNLIIWTEVAGYYGLSHMLRRVTFDPNPYS